MKKALWKESPYWSLDWIRLVYIDSNKSSRVHQSEVFFENKGSKYIIYKQDRFVALLSSWLIIRCLLSRKLNYTSISNTLALSAGKWRHTNTAFLPAEEKSVTLQATIGFGYPTYSIMSTKKIFRFELQKDLNEIKDAPK